MRKKTTAKDWATLIGFGLVGLMIYQIVIAAVALLLGFFVSWVFDVRWYIAGLVSYFVIRFIIAGAEAFADLKPIRCPECKKEIKTSLPVKCEQCGGAALLVED